jgi:hypothetical protein
MKHENNYDILLADALHSSDSATRACKISFRRYPFEDILRRTPIGQMQRSAQTISPNDQPEVVPRIGFRRTRTQSAAADGTQ